VRGANLFFRLTFFCAAMAVCFAVSAQSLPNLNVVLSNNQTVTVSWTIPTVSTVLQEATNLTSPAVWQNSSLIPASNACAFSVTVPATDAARFFRLVATTTPTIGLYLGTPTNLFHAGQLNMFYVPDMHIAMVQQPHNSNSYHLFISGVIGTNNGSTGFITTTNFVDFKPGIGNATNAVAVFTPDRQGGTNDYQTNFNSDYAGANTIFTATNGADLLMIYHGETRSFGTNPPNAHAPFFAEVGLARSTNGGVSWTNEGAIISGSDSKPDVNPTTDVNGTPEPSAIIASNYIYVFYPFFPTSTNGHSPGPPAIQVARAPVSSDGAPTNWFKYYSNSFGLQPGLGGFGSQIVPTVCACSSPRQPWVAYSTYLNAYVMVYVSYEGWFFSTSTDLVNWTAPTQFYTAPPGDTLFTAGEQNDENVILVTPGNAPQVIGQTGLVLYAHTPSFGYGGGSGSSVPHELWSRPFTFTKSP
jgi:hypothetical protein